MSYARVLCVGVVGVTGHLVQVEADLSTGLPTVVLTGLPDAALHEARDRVRAAVVNSGQRWPQRRITVNLLPAMLPKHGSGFDLAIACALLAGAGELPLAPLDGIAVLGELGLDGAVRPIRGVLPMVVAAVRAGITRVVVPVENAHEAAVVPGVTVHAVDSLHRLVSFVRGTAELLDPPPAEPTPPLTGPDLADVAGQQWGRFGLEVAAAGGHHLNFLGPPGAGKTMLAERLPSILPELDDIAALEVTALHSVAGLLPAGGRLVRRPPFQAPHHSASVAALIGGGSGLARPGALSLAHRGVLFLDERREPL
jgi:magnesium chelatase family protein